MGCVSSSFLEEEGSVGGGSGGFRHHIVSLTSTTYGLLTTLDNPTATPPPRSPPCPPPPPPPPPSHFSRLTLHPRSEPEVINSWELMADLDFTTNTKEMTFSSNSTSSFRFSHSDPHRKSCKKASDGHHSLEMFEKRCPPGGEDSVVIYTTTLRGIRKTFEECNAVRAILEAMGVWIKERDVSMDMGFRDELKELMKGSSDGYAVPRVFVRGRYVGGAEQVLKIHEEGWLGKILEGLPKARVGEPCDGCGGARFLPCFRCCGGRKVVVRVMVVGKERGMMVRCPECNENGLVLCPICC